MLARGGAFGGVAGSSNALCAVKRDGVLASDRTLCRGASICVSPTPGTRAGRRGSERHRRPPLAPVAPRINRVLRVMQHTHWSAEALSQVRVEFKRAIALRSEIRRAGSFN